MHELPERARYTLKILLDQLDVVEHQIEEIEERMKAVFEATEEIRFLMTMPGAGFILAVVIHLGVGDVGRFARSESLASYSGTVPSVRASGGKVRYGHLHPDTNHYLK